MPAEIRASYTEFPICLNGAKQDSPAISGNIVIWRDSRNGNDDIYGYDLSTKTEFPICLNSAWQYCPAISGNIVVWEDDRNGFPDIYGYDLSTKTEFPICLNSAWQSFPAISGNIVVWADYRNGNDDIYGYDLSTKTEFPICTYSATQSSPAISGNIVVWADTRRGNWDIYGYDLSTKTEFPICTNGAHQSLVAISGNIVIWKDYRNGWDIYGYDLSTKTEFPICLNSAYQSYPAISGNIVIWTDERNGNWDIYGYDLSTKTEFPICTNSATQSMLAISGNIVIWMDYRNDKGDIYGLALEEPPVADADGPYDVNVGDTLTLDASGSTDVDDDIVSYMWDLDDDGSFETDAGGEAIFDVNYTSLQLLGLLVNHPYIIGLKVTDSEGQSDTADSTLIIVPKPATVVAVDIKPGSCPNPVNVKSSGVLPVAILGTEDVNVITIDPTSVRLAGVEPLRSGFEDVAGPVSDSNDCNCTTDGPDGFLDLTLKFKTQRIVEAIGDVNHGDVVVLELTGVLFDPIPYETPIEGADCILIKGKHKAHNKADINKDGVVDMTDFAIVGENWLQSSVVED